MPCCRAGAGCVPQHTQHTFAFSFTVPATPTSAPPLRRSAAPPPRAPRPAETPRSAPVTMAARASRSTGATAREPPQIAPSQINGPPLLPPTGSQQSAGRRARLRPGLTPMDKVKVLPARNGLRACDYSLGGSCSTRPVLILRASGCARRARCAGRRRQPAPPPLLAPERRQRARPSGGVAPVAGGAPRDSLCAQPWNRRCASQ